MNGHDGQAFSPNFALLGVGKAGTTSIAKYLRQHPNVCVSRPKERW
jgi:hypothetical protein